MKVRKELLDEALEGLRAQFEWIIDEKSDSYVLSLPFKDGMGDNFVIRVRDGDEKYAIDDAGTIGNTLFTIRETIRDRKSEQMARALIDSFGAAIDLDEGTIGFQAKYEEIQDKILHLSKLMVSLDTILTQRIKEERKEERSQRQSLGPRASQKIRKSLHSMIEEGLVNYRYMVDGLTIPDWLVDFAYKPLMEPLVQTSELIVVITVDLAVLDPIMKSAHAFSRAVDIKAAHQNYEIRVAYDTHGQNSNSENAANFLREHQLYRNEYLAIDVSETGHYVDFLNNISREVALDLRY